jgi:hypothetical protein
VATAAGERRDTHPQWNREHQHDQQRQDRKFQRRRQPLRDDGGHGDLQRERLTDVPGEQSLPEPQVLLPQREVQTERLALCLHHRLRGVDPEGIAHRIARDQSDHDERDCHEYEDRDGEASGAAQEKAAPCSLFTPSPPALVGGQSRDHRW